MIVRITKSALAALSFLQLLNFATAQAITYKGCYSSPGILSDAGYYRWQSSGYCQGVCSGQGKAVMGLKNGSDCFCGDLLPSPDDKTDDSACSTPCQGYGDKTCGGPNAWQVFLTGLNNDVGALAAAGGGSGPNVAPPKPLTTEFPVIKTVEGQVTTVQQPTIVTVGGGTIVKTIDATPQGQASAPAAAQPSGQTSDEGSSSGSKIGIAVGVVVGVVVLAAGIVTVVIFLRRKKKQNTHHRATSLNGFYRGGSGAPSVTDSRLDPSMVERRNSVGSVFADNEDYSRRILKVTNPDGTR